MIRNILDNILEFFESFGFILTSIFFPIHAFLKIYEDLLSRSSFLFENQLWFVWRNFFTIFAFANYFPSESIQWFSNGFLLDVFQRYFFFVFIFRFHILLRLILIQRNINWLIIDLYSGFLKNLFLLLNHDILYLRNSCFKGLLYLGF